MLRGVPNTSGIGNSYDFDQTSGKCAPHTISPSPKDELSHRVQTHRVQTHRVQTHRVQTHRVQTHRVQTHRVQTHRVQTPFFGIESRALGHEVPRDGATRAPRSVGWRTMPCQRFVKVNVSTSDSPVNARKGCSRSGRQWPTQRVYCVATGAATGVPSDENSETFSLLSHE